MPDGFEYDPEAVRAFAEVFRQASAQVEQVRTTLGRPSATADDFGASWHGHGEAFAAHLAAITEDLAHLSAGLTAVGEHLADGTDLVVAADTSALASLRPAGDGQGSPA